MVNLFLDPFIFACPQPDQGLGDLDVWWSHLSRQFWDENKIKCCSEQTMYKPIISERDRAMPQAIGEKTRLLK